jgi:hypothetical protein
MDTPDRGVHDALLAEQDISLGAPALSSVFASGTAEAAEQLIARQIRRDIQYRLILRQNAGEELPLQTTS